MEQFEPRLLLSADMVAAGLVSGCSTVSSAWFESLTGSVTEAGVLSESQAVKEINWNGESLTVVPDRWIVQFQSESLEGITSVAGVEGLLSGTEVNFSLVSGLGLTGLVLITTYGADVQAVSDWLGADPDVAYFEPDAVLRLQVIPNDTSFSSLWGLNNTGQTGGTADADIDAPEAWNLTTGSSTVVIAVIDTGMDYTHPDLAANVWINPGEIAGDGIDNDGNGYIDDIYGWDFAYDDSDPMDGDGHGTHVSGTIGAVGNNATGVTGVNWNVKIMALKFLDDSGSGSTADAVLGVNYATMMKRDYGVNIVATNNSWGGGGYSSALYNAIAVAGEEGILFIAAAGNGGDDNIGDNDDVIPFYPACYDLDNIISVAATDDDDLRASFSNYGLTSVDLAAPGVSIYSTLPNKKYGSYSGTSMATPHVTGVVALLAAYDPSASAGAIKLAILNSVDPIAAMDGLCVTGGRLNAYQALLAIDVPGPRVLSVSPSGDSPPVDEITVRFTEDILPASVTGSNFLLRDNGADNVFDTADDTVYVLADSDLSQGPADTITLSLASMLGIEQYRLTLVGTGADPIRNLDGEALNNGADEIFLFQIISASGPYEPNDEMALATDSGLTGPGTATFSAYIGDGYYGSKDVDLYAVTVAAGATLIADIDAQANGSSLDAMLRLFDSGGNELVLNDDASGLDSYFRYDLPAAGTYYVGVCGWDNSVYDPAVPNSGAAGSTGSYQLKLTLGSARLGEILGAVWSDQDGDGNWDQGEGGLEGWTVYLDLNGTGSYEPEFVASAESTDVPKSIPDRGTVTSSLTVSGFTSVITDVNVTLSIAHTRDSDLVVTLISPGGTRVELFNAVGGSGDHFLDTTLDDEASLAIGSGAAPFSGTYRPSGSLSNFDGENANGTWQLEVKDSARLYTGTLMSWSLTVTTGEPGAVTVSGGGYVLGDLPAGTYTVAEVLQEGWTQTHPAGGADVVILATGAVVDDINFGNQLIVPPSVTGITLNGDSAKSVSSIEPSGIGVQTVTVTFSEAVNFAAGDVVVQKVTFPGGVETLGDVLTPTSVTGSGTDTMTITFASASVVDTWVKVTLGDTIMDLAGIALDGEAPADGSERGYIYDATDLPTGDGTAGGDAVFYVGSLRGDLYGGSFFDPVPNGKLNSLDVAAFIAAYQAGDLSADFYGNNFFDPVPNGVLNSLDVAAFISAYQAGASLEALPTSLGEQSLGLEEEMFVAKAAMPASLVQEEEAASEVPDGDISDTDAVLDAGEADVPPADPSACEAAYSSRAGKASASTDSCALPDADIVDSLELSEPLVPAFEDVPAGSDMLDEMSERALRDVALADAESGASLPLDGQSGGQGDVLNLLELTQLEPSRTV